MTKEKSLKRYLHQAVRQVFASHHLLEFCCATNSYKKGAKYCLTRIFKLTYHLGTLENILRNANPNKTTLEKLVKSYEHVKYNTDVLMCEISAALNYVKPANQSSSDSEWSEQSSILYWLDRFFQLTPVTYLLFILICIIFLLLFFTKIFYLSWDLR